MEETVAPTLLNTIAAFAPKAVVILTSFGSLTAGVSSCLCREAIFLHLHAWLFESQKKHNESKQDMSRHTRKSKGVSCRVSQVIALIGVAGAWDFSVEPGVHILWSAAGRNAYSITGPLDGLGSVHVSGCLRMFDLDV